MDVRDRLFLGPIDKYRKHDRYPWQMVIALTLAVLTSVNVLAIVSQLTNYSYSQLTVLNFLFLNPTVPVTQAAGSDTALSTVFYIFDIPSLLAYIRGTVDTYAAINSLTFDHYEYTEAHGPAPSMRLMADYLSNDAVTVGTK